MDFTKLKQKIIMLRGDDVTQTQLSEILKIQQSRLSKIARGRILPTLEELEKFCKYFKCTLNDLVDIKED